MVRPVGVSSTTQNQLQNNTQRFGVSFIVEMNGQGRPTGLRVSYVAPQHVDLTNAAERASFKNYLSGLLMGTVGDAELDQALSPNGLITKAIVSREDTDIGVDAMEFAAAPEAPVLAPRQKIAKSTHPVPPKPAPTVKSNTLKPVAAAPRFKNEMHRAQWQTYAQGKAMVASKIADLQARPASADNAAAITKLKGMDHVLDVASEFLSKDSVSAPQIGVYRRRIDNAANVLYGIVYFSALQEAQKREPSDYELRRSGPAARIHASEAESTACKLFGLAAGDPLGTANFWPPDDFVDALSR